MIARDVIAGATGITGTWSAATKAGFILEALTAAGYRIIGPDEPDPVTLERAAEVADRRPHASNKSIAKAVRSLKKEGGGG